MYLPFFCFWTFLSDQFLNFRCTLMPRLIIHDRTYQNTFSRKYNPSRRLKFCFIKSKNIRLRFIASSFRTSMSYFHRLRAIIYCSNNTSLPAILMHGLHTFVLLNFRKPVCILNMCKIKNFSLPSTDWTRIEFWQLRHTKHWVIVWVSIYNLNFEK